MNLAWSDPTLPANTLRRSTLTPAPAEGGAGSKRTVLGWRVVGRKRGPSEDLTPETRIGPDATRSWSVPRSHPQKMGPLLLVPPAPRNGMQRRNCPRAYVRSLRTDSGKGPDRYCRLHCASSRSHPQIRGPCSAFRRTLSRGERGNVQRGTGLSANSGRTGWRLGGSGKL